MGAKTFRWEDSGETAESKFNFSTDQNAKDLWDFFEMVTSSQRAFLELKRTVRHDKLGVWDALQKITDLWTDSRLVGTAQFLPLFDAWRATTPTSIWRGSGPRSWPKQCAPGARSKIRQQ